MALPFLRRPLNAREQAVADRLPPGQFLTEKWPVLHYSGEFHFHDATGTEEIGSTRLELVAVMRGGRHYSCTPSARDQ